MSNNYLHLDLKGIIPEWPEILNWLEFFADCGYQGIVWEYEDKYPWRSWPGTFRPRYTAPQWEAVWAKCLELNLEIIPLVQTQGHLEWLLKHDEYANWRENGCWNEICPKNAEAVSRISRWLDEVMALHPHSRYIHIGADETWNLASCPDCAVAAVTAANGKLQIYIDHISRMAAQVIAKGLQPMIWGDMFWREGRPELAALLPEETILIDWQYAGAGPWETTAQLAATGLQVWGASAVSCGFDLSRNLASIRARLDNVGGWLAQAGQVGGIIHTTWSRSRSLMPVYGPWHGAVPGFMAAGGNGLWEKSELCAWADRMDSVLSRNDMTLQRELKAALESVSFTDRYAEETRKWWLLALGFNLLREQFIQRSMFYSYLEAAGQHMGNEPDFINHCRRGSRVLTGQLEDWCDAVRAFFKANNLSDADEFSVGRKNALLNLIRYDWAEQKVPVNKPNTVR